MRILFLTLYPNTAASPRYRVAQFLPYLQAQGFDCTVACALSDAEFGRLSGPNRRVRPLWYHLYETPRRLRQLAAAKEYDVVFVQKAIMTAYVRGAFGLLRSRARRLIYDLDDAVHLAPPHPLRGLARVFEDRSQVLRLMRAAALVLAGNAWLATEAENAGARATVFPTVVDTERFTPARQAPEVFRVGWIGNASTSACLEPIADVLAKLDDAEISLVGAPAAPRQCPQAQVRPWSLDTEQAELHRFSVGLMPLLKTEWMRGKCALKALQYMACGIPCVATPYGAVQDIIRHGENGLLADTPEEWDAALTRLRDPAYRRQLGEAGRATVEAQYSLKTAGPRLAQLLRTVA